MNYEAAIFGVACSLTEDIGALKAVFVSSGTLHPDLEF